MNTYFCGLAGSGKTELGERLAERLGRPFFDLDREADLRLGYSFHRFVEERGWLAFRELEYEICKDFVKKDGAVMSLGGGTVRYDWNRDVLRPNGYFILLEASIETLVGRVRMADRPRVNAGASLEEDLSTLWERSKDKYFAVADLRYRTDAKTIDQEVDELELLVRG